MNVGKHVEPSGWFFEFENPYYPDTDDTAMALTSLRRLGGPAAKAAIGRGVPWLLAFQNGDGGWAAFDKTRHREVLEHIPFADHNAMQDPSCPDIAGRVLESLGHNGLRVGQEPVDRAVAFLRREQDASGAWWGRWGVNYVYGTWQVLAGLRSVGQDMTADWVRRAADWLRVGPEARRQLRRDHRQLRRPRASRAPANRPPARPPGARWACWPSAAPATRPSQRGVAWLVAHQATRRGLGRAAVHRHRLPQGLLPEVPPVPALLPAHGPGAVPAVRWPGVGPPRRPRCFVPPVPTARGPRP